MLQTESAVYVWKVSHMVHSSQGLIGITHLNTVGQLLCKLQLTFTLYKNEYRRKFDAGCLQGTNSAEDFTIAASRFANQLKTYENAAGPVVSVNQGAECKDFWDHLLGAGHTAESASLQENSSYDKDFEV